MAVKIIKPADWIFRRSKHGGIIIILRNARFILLQHIGPKFGPRTESSEGRVSNCLEDVRQRCVQDNSLESLFIQCQIWSVLRCRNSIVPLDRCFEQSLDVAYSLKKFEVLAHNGSVAPRCDFKHPFSLSSIFVTWFTTSEGVFLAPHEDGQGFLNLG